MFKPVTELGIFFSEECKKINDFFNDYRSINIAGAGNEKLSSILLDFFTVIHSLPAKLDNLDFNLSILFEIDQAIIGTYGTKIFYEPNPTPIRKLLKDIMALWYRYDLLANIERKNPNFMEILGIRNFYEEWLRNEQVGIKDTEYERILNNISILIDNTDNLDVNTRFLVFNMLGNILITLGLTWQDAEKNLLKYSHDIKDRINPSKIALGEILVNLYVIHTLGVGFNNLASINTKDLKKAIRYWGCADALTDTIFKSWNFYVENDYYSELTQEEKDAILKNKSSLYFIADNKVNQLDIGHSFIEYWDYRKRNEDTITFNPVRIFMIGNSNVGKSSYLMSFAYDALERINMDYSQQHKNTTLGKEYQAFFHYSLESWNTLAIQPTGGYNEYSYWMDEKLNSFMVTDYEGKNSRPDQWDSKLQDLLKNARALLFFIDDTDYLDPMKLRQKASLFDLFLQYWTSSNPRLKHIPIGLVLTKSDMIFGEFITNLKRKYLVPDNIIQASIENYFEKRLSKSFTDQLKTPYGRFYDMIINEKFNNSHPSLQDIIETILDNFAQFFIKVLDITYNYQIFLTSSLPPVHGNQYPFGVREPLTWVSDSLEKLFINETIDKYNSEEKKLSEELKAIEQDKSVILEKSGDIEKLDAQIRELRDTKHLVKIIFRDLQIKEWEKNRKNTEIVLQQLLKRYNSEIDYSNKKLLEDYFKSIIEDKKETLEALIEKKRYYESRK